MDPILLNAARLAAVIALVDIAKRMGLSANMAAIAATVVGVALYVAGEVYPPLNVALIGLSAAGVYTLVQKVGQDAI